MERPPLVTSTKQNIEPSEPEEASPIKSEPQVTRPPSARKARFSALAADLQEFEYDCHTIQNKPKEAYMRGRSARLSIGETRPSVLCTPAGNAAIQKLQHQKSSTSISFSPEKNDVTSSTMLGGSAGMMDLTISSIDCSNITLKSKDLQESKKKVFSPTNFTPKSTSSPKDLEMSPAKLAALEKSTAKTIKFQFEQKLKNQENVVIPMPKQFVKLPVKSNPKPEVYKENSKKVDLIIGNMKSLKNRWELSSSTGTPIHPDAPEEELLAAANRMKNTSSHRSVTSNKSTSQNEEESVASESEPPIEDEVFDTEPRDLSTPSDASRIIDQAFEFMKYGTPSPCRPSPLAVRICRDSPLARNNEIIEEEDIPMGSDEEEDEETKAHGDFLEKTQEKEEYNLPYSVSFYRKIQKERTNLDVSSTINRANSPEEEEDERTLSPVFKNLARDQEDVKSKIEAEKERLKSAIKVEEEHISQSKRALALCRETRAFNGSREEIEMQRALLTAVEKQKALFGELNRLENDGLRIIDGPLGDFSVVQLSVTIAKEYIIRNATNSKKSAELYYFIALLKYGEQVKVSQIATSESALMQNGGVMDFTMPLTLSKIPPNFEATLEIYGQKSLRESLTHEDKYNLKGSKSKNKGNSMMVPPAFSLSVTETNFNLIKQLSFKIDCPGKQKFQISDKIYPLDGWIIVKVRRRVCELVNFELDGFLSMYQRTSEGLGNWTRYWCVLSAGEMKFWKHPEDENVKERLVSIDLATCLDLNGASTVSDICPYPNSFYIDVWVPKEEDEKSNEDSIKTGRMTTDDIEPLRVMLAADTQLNLENWLTAINHSSRQLCTWRNPIPLKNL